MRPHASADGARGVFLAYDKSMLAAAFLVLGVLMFTYARLIGAIDSDISLSASYGRAFSDGYARLCGYLRLEDIFTPDAIYVAAQRASVGFREKRDTERFMRAPWENSLRLCDSVINGSFVPRYYRPYAICERGKVRTIVPPTFECKVVQKVLCELLLRPLLTHRMIATSYASICGRGTDAMYEDVLSAINHVMLSPRMCWHDYSVVMCDYRSYFVSIDVGLLERLVLRRYIRDDAAVDMIMRFFPDRVGLPIGSEISQMPATFFPSPVDHRMKDDWGLPYFRYMDDTLAIVPNQLVCGYVREYQRLSGRLGLSCPDEKVGVVHLGKCFSFCKERFRFVRHGVARYVREINPRRVSAERRKLRRFEDAVRSGEMTIDGAMAHASGVIGGIARHPRARGDVRMLRERAQVVRDAAGVASGCPSGASSRT